MDRFSKSERSALMSRIRGRRTGPEMVVHGWLKGNHVKHMMWPDLTGRPDILVHDGGSGTAVFVNGCFWHGCGKHFRIPKTNAGFWREKIWRNTETQRRSARALRLAGYRVFVVWEHEVRSGAWKRLFRGKNYGHRDF